MMLAVAVVAVAIGAETTRRRRESYRKKAVHFAKLEQDMRQLATSRNAQVARRKREASEVRTEGDSVKESPDYQRNSRRLAEAMMQRTALLEAEADHLQQRADLYARLLQKYEHAACFPWLPVEADPDEPQ
jgi:hypothetical protein